MSLYDFLYGINRSLVRLSKLSIARDVENGLEYLHHKNIIHADIKSLNILIDGATGKAVLSDFGLAYMKNKLPFQMTYGGNKYSSLIIGEKKVAGTLRWMAPELFETGEYSNESDIYAYGIVLYELIYKKIPFSRVANKDVPKLVCNNRRPETSTLTHPVEIALASLMHKCWDQRAEYRPKHLEIQRELSVIRDVQDQEDTVSPNYTASMANQSSIYAHFSVNPLTALGRFAQPRQKTGLQQTLTL